MVMTLATRFAAYSHVPQTGGVSEPLGNEIRLQLL